MKRRAITRAVTVLLSGAAAMMPAHVPAADKWFLMARHGECSEVSSLKRRVPELGDVVDPQGFATLMRSRGLQVTTTDFPVPRGKAQEVKVPERELSFLFVTPESCTGFSKR